MDSDEDDIYDTPSPRAGLKRRPVARKNASHTSKPKAAKKRKTEVQAKAPRPQRSIINNSLRGPDWTVKDMAGDCPPYNEYANWVHDPHHQKVYMIGGTRPGDKREMPTSDFYCYCTTNLKWENLTNSFTFREPYRPYSKIDLKREKKPLPALLQPGCTLWRPSHDSDESFLFLFGGYDKKTREASSKVIFINLKFREWWYQESMGDVSPRIAPAIVAIENQVYIFGGYKKFVGPPQACYSYSIAEWSSASTWTWQVRDTPYSGQMPADFVVGQAVAVHGGTKILLTPGRLNNANRLRLTDRNIFYFQIKYSAFQQILSLVGDPLPQDIGWYSVFEFKQPAPQPPLAAVISPRKPGRPPKNPQPPKENSQQTSISQSSSDSVVICAWIPRPGTALNDQLFAPELYHFFYVAPNDHIDCLNVIQQVCDLEPNFQKFMFVEGKMNLLGSDSNSDNISATWNKFIDIPYPRREQ